MTMRFFTPELYLRFNSDDDRVADEADNEWERTLTAYRRHVEAIEPQMPVHVKELSQLHLHDAPLLAWHDADPDVCILTVMQGGELISLVYVLADAIEVAVAPPDWPLPVDPINWLYDEMEHSANDKKVFEHRILLSDGRVIHISFTSVIVHRFSLARAFDASSLRRSA
jgi:hypothetical protein